MVKSLLESSDMTILCVIIPYMFGMVEILLSHWHTPQIRGKYVPVHWYAGHVLQSIAICVLASYAYRATVTITDLITKVEQRAIATQRMPAVPMADNEWHTRSESEHCIKIQDGDRVIQWKGLADGRRQPMLDFRGQLPAKAAGGTRCLGDLSNIAQCVD